MAHIKQQPNGTFKLSIRRKGYKAIYATFDTLEEAEIYAEDIETQMKRGKKIVEYKSESVTLKDALLRYMNEVSINKNGHKQEKNRILALCKLPLADWYLAEITSMQVAEYRDSELLRGMSPSTIKNNLSIVGQVFKECKEWGMPEVVNPVEGLRKPKDRAARDRRFAAGEEDLIIKHIDPLYRNAFIFSLETAARRGEVLRINRSDLDIKSRTATIVKPKGKKNDRIIPLSDRAIQAIRNEPANINGRVFNLVPDTYTHKFKDACTEAGISNLTLHDVRHEATSRFVESGLFRDSEIMKITGHTTLKSFMVYVQIDAEKLAKRLNSYP